MSTLKIDEVKVANRGKRLEPLRIKFSHCKTPINNDVQGSVKAGIYSDSLNENEYVSICQADNMCYMGNTKEENHEERLYIALKNKFTNKVKLVEVSKVSLSPIVQYPHSTNPLLLEKEGNTDKKSRNELSKDFVHRFGMLRGQRLYDQAERLTVKAETGRANLENAAINTTVEDSELVLPKSSDSFEMMYPQRNSEANVASEVYLLENIICFNDMDALEEVGKILLTGDLENPTQFSDHFTKELNRLKHTDSLNAEQKLQLSKALLYMEGLIKICTIKEKKLYRDVVKTNLPGIMPESIIESIRGNFTSHEGPSWTLTKMCRERTICHVLALALVIGNCAVDAESLCSSLKTDIDSLYPLIQVVGARLVKDKSNEDSKIVLTIPLANPPQKRGQMNKRKDNYKK